MISPQRLLFGDRRGILEWGFGDPMLAIIAAIFATFLAAFLAAFPWAATP